MLNLKLFSLLFLSIGINLFTSTSENSNYEQQVEDYINQYKFVAIDEMHRTGIPASITLAQGIHESQAGFSALATQANNHFGIKCKKYWKGKTYYHNDDDYDTKGNLMKSCFRVYNSAQESYEDHSDFLRFTRHYQSLFNYSNTDFENWATGLQKCGYATDKKYATKLIQTIKKFDLSEYDLFIIKFE